MLHSKLGASSAKRWMSCPGSIRLIAQCPPQPTNKYAAEGTVAHKLGETCLNEKCKPEKYLGWYGNGETDSELYQEETGHEFEFEVTKDMCIHVKVYLDTIRDKMEELELAGHHPQLYVEQSFRLDFVQEGMFGTNDASIFVPGVYLGVFDLKYGKGLVEVEDNTQLNYYACGSLRLNCYKYEIDPTSYFGLPETVETVIIQPRGRHANGPVRRWETTPQYLLGDFAKRLQAAARETQNSNAELHEGDHCYWCPAKSICPAIENRVQEELHADFANIDPNELDDPKATAKTKAKQKVSERSPEDLAALLTFLPIIESWVADIKGLAKGKLESGDSIPGYKLVEGQSRRSYKSKKEALDYYALFFDDPAEYTKPPEPKSFTEMEKLPGMADVVAELTKRGKPSLSIAMVNDSRPATTALSSKAIAFDTKDIEDELA